MRKAVTDTQCNIKATHFHFSACVEVFLGDTVNSCVKDFEYIYHNPSRRVVTLTCRQELKLLVKPPKPLRSRMREEAKNNPGRREV
jgi:hypothetical protein